MKAFDIICVIVMVLGLEVNGGIIEILEAIK